MAFFWRTPTHELQAAAFGTVLRECGLLRSARPSYRPDLAEVARVCDAYHAFRSFCPETVISFEHGWYLLQVLARLDEYVLARCPDCRALWIRDNLGLLPDNCVACRTRLPPGMLARD